MQDAPPPAIVSPAPEVPPGFGVDPDRSFDILVRRPCEQPAAPGEIVVCGQAEDRRHRLEPLPVLPAMPTLMERIQRALTIRLGPLEIGPSGPHGSSVGITIRIRDEDEKE